MKDSKITILIVDDEPINLEIICALLEDSDYELAVANDGQQAWHMLESNPNLYDSIILDRMMPGMDGMEVLAKLKSHEAMQNIPVVMQTARSENQDIIEGLNAGAYYYLTKPYDGELLKSVVRSAVTDRLHELSLLDSLTAGRRIFQLMTFGRFKIYDLVECNLVSSQVAHICPEPRRVVTGISELLINGLEHGNLGISYEEKSDLMRRGIWRSEVERRIENNRNIDSYIELEFSISKEDIQIKIRDQGDGFDWNPYLEFDPDRAFDPHGRGIAVSRLSSFDNLEYIGKGNEVVAIVNVPEPG